MKKDKKTLRIGNASGYWGDDPKALARQIKMGSLDYITMDFLAEITMSILQKQREKDPNLGYAKDFISMLKEVLPDLIGNGTKIITNAGGINPEACAKAISELAENLGLKVKVAIVSGDDILSQIKDLYPKKASFKNMETGESFDDVCSNLACANVYYGAAPVVEALERWNPDIIVTGRVTDTGITVGAMVYEFGWSLKDWDKLASGVVAGHILECGSQATGGNFTDWKKIKSFDEIGYPICEVSSDGSFVVTKHEGTGGLVSVDTVREQLFYEMGNPEAYLTPDVVADFSTIQLKSVGENKVHVSQVRGYAPTKQYKISMAYYGGFKAIGSIIISGPEAKEKAETFAKIFWKRMDESYEETSTEFLGLNACQASLSGETNPGEILLRLGARDSDFEKMKRFSKAAPSLILSGPPGVAVMGGAAKIQTIVNYWPALIDKIHVNPEIKSFENLQEVFQVKSTEIGDFEVFENKKIQVATKVTLSIEETLRSFGPHASCALSKICLGRSGDKGDSSNIGIMARSPLAYRFLKEFLTAQRVKNLFYEICYGKVIRYELDNMHGLNFILEESLGGGGSATLRLDAQGKTFAQALLRQRIFVPKEVLDDLEER